MIKGFNNFSTINSKVIGSVFAASFVFWVAYLGILFLVVTRKLKVFQAILAITASVLSWVIALFVKSQIPQPRPFQTNGYPPLTLTVPGDFAFPSAHTAAIFGLATFIWLANRKLGIIFFVFAVIVSLGRIISNVHFPVDVAGGALVGMFIALVIDSFVPKGVKKARKR